MRMTRILAIAAAMAAAGTAAAATGEYWEVKQRMSMQGMDLPAQQSRVCKPLNATPADMASGGDSNDATQSNYLPGRSAAVVCSVAQLTFAVLSPSPDSAVIFQSNGVVGPNSNSNYGCKSAYLHRCLALGGAVVT